ncbi:MAG TPA: YciI family protein [Pseudonocardia sp.]
MPRFWLLTRYDESLGVPPMTEWDPADMEAHLAWLTTLNAELVESGELVEVTALVSPELAKVVTAGGPAGVVVTDGPFGEAKEVLAGYQVVDVESEERALEIAGRVSAAPGPGGVPLRQRIEVRQVMGPV